MYELKMGGRKSLSRREGASYIHSQQPSNGNSVPPLPPPQTVSISQPITAPLIHIPVINKMQMAEKECQRPESGICTSVGGWSILGVVKEGRCRVAATAKAHCTASPIISLACSRPSFY